MVVTAELVRLCTVTVVVPGICAVSTPVVLCSKIAEAEAVVSVNEKKWLCCFSVLAVRQIGVHQLSCRQCIACARLTSSK
jgi:hypothetical protein